MGALSQSDMALWHAWKAATQVVRDRVVAEVGAATGLSEPDFGVLTRVVELGDGTLRQNELAASMGWHRTRLSHHLSRMEQRKLVTRAPADDGVAVTVTAAGRELVAVARPLHADAVRRHLADLIPGEDRAGSRRSWPGSRTAPARSRRARLRACSRPGNLPPVGGARGRLPRVRAGLPRGSRECDTGQCDRAAAELGNGRQLAEPGERDGDRHRGHEVQGRRRFRDVHPREGVSPREESGR